MRSLILLPSHVALERVLAKHYTIPEGLQLRQELIAGAIENARTLC